MPSTNRLNPYKSSWELRIRASKPFDPTNETLDLSWLEKPAQEAGFQEFDLIGSDPAWREIHFNINADLPRAELDKILPSVSEASTDTALLVSVRCATTKYRRVVKLDPAKANAWIGELMIRRQDVRSVVEFIPLLVRTTSIPSESDEYAVERGSVLAEGLGVRVHIDEVDRGRTGIFTMLWEDFRASDHPWRREHPSDLYYLELGDDPELWLNSSYPQFRQTLSGADEVGINACLRHMASGLVAQSVWLQLFPVAALGIEVDPDTGMVSSPDGWRRSLLDTFLPRIFPNLATNEERLRRTAEMVRSHDQAGPLMTLCGSAVQAACNTANLFQQAVRAAERGGENDQSEAIS